jgi:hypothetical protein
LLKKGWENRKLQYSVEINYKKIIQVYEIDTEEFKKEIFAGVEKLLKEFSEQFIPNQPEIWMSRKDVRELFGISLVTIYN